MITAVAATHDRVPLELRERLAVATDGIAEVLPRLAGHLGPCAILGTCNRFEIYVAADVTFEQIRKALIREAGIDLAAAGEGLRFLRDQDAGRHIFRVAAGLESMVLGEHEILGQVRRAYSTAVDAEVSSPALARLFHGAVRAGRRVRGETPIGVGARSVARYAAERAAALRDLRSARVLIVGAGDAARQAAVALRDEGASNFVIANRTMARGQLLAIMLGGAAVPLDALASAVASADIVFGAAGGAQPLLHTEHIEPAADRERALLIFDLGVPRNVAFEAAALGHVDYYDIEGLRASVSEQLQVRDEARPAAEAIVEAELVRLLEWLEQREAVPSIALLVERADRVRRHQVERTARALHANEEQRAHLEAMSRALVKQLLHPAIVSARRDDAARDNVRALRALFQLDAPDCD